MDEGPQAPLQSGGEDADDHLMRRATGRHNRSASDVYTEHAGVAPSPESLREGRRAERVLRAVLVVVLPLVLVGILTAEAAPYWDQPEQVAAITAATPDGTITERKVTCDASRFTVQGADGRTGNFRACADERTIGGEVHVRWRSATSGDVGVDVLTWAQVLGIGVLALLGCAVAALIGARSDRRRRERQASPTFRTRGGSASG